MNRITVVIPTRNRFAKLEVALASIPTGPDLNVVVICDGDPKTHEALTANERPYLQVFQTDARRGAVYCRNLVSPLVEDGLLYATDDIEFLPGAIERAWQTFNQEFPDDDGVVGFHQLEPHHPAGVALVGKTFLDRYPRRKLFCPEYDHFACQEVFWLAQRLNRFYYDEQAKLKHFHPGFYKDRIDETHADARAFRKRDHELIALRQAEGLIWGLQA